MTKISFQDAVTVLHREEYIENIFLLEENVVEEIIYIELNFSHIKNGNNIW